MVVCVLSGCLAHRRIRWVCWLVSQRGEVMLLRGRPFPALETWVSPPTTHEWSTWSSIFPAMSLIQVQVRSPRTIVYSYEIFPFSTSGFIPTSLYTSLCNNQNLVVFRATLVTVQLNLKGSHSLLWSGLGRTVSQVQLLLGQQPTSSGTRYVQLLLCIYNLCHAFL